MHIYIYIYIYIYVCMSEPGRARRGRGAAGPTGRESENRVQTSGEIPYGS